MGGGVHHRPGGQPDNRLGAALGAGAAGLCTLALLTAAAGCALKPWPESIRYPVRQRTLLKGLEVCLIIVAFRLHSRARVSNGIAALIALAAVIVADLSVGAPLRRVLENPIKFVWSAP